MIAHPDTVRFVQVIHDTISAVVHDTVVRMVAPQETAGVDTAIAEWTTALGTVGLVCVGWLALQTWQQEFRAKLEYRLAHRVYVAVLRLNDRIKSTRSGFHMLWLSKEESEDKKRVLQLRYEQYVKAFREVVRADLALLALEPEVQLLWGVEGTNHLVALDERARKLRGGFHAYFSHSFKALEDAQWEAYVESDARTAFEPLGDDVDQYGLELTRRVEAATAFLLPKLALGKSKQGSPS
ncbi:MAG: hypothetical protein ABL977_02715 [Candidatus Eisenbacteria bacterium]